jgi:DNA-binding PadR family transcriptional regulator
MPGKFLAEFELYVMLAMARLGNDAYGASIRKEIQKRTGRPVSIGALYATLARLGEKGMVTFRVSKPQPVQGGRARKYCHLTESGKEALEHSATMLGRMMDGLDLAHQADGGS